MVSETTEKKLLTERETATYLSVSQSYLRRARLDGVRTGHTPGPAFVRFGRSIRYLAADLDSWVAQHRIEAL